VLIGLLTQITLISIIIMFIKDFMKIRMCGADCAKNRLKKGIVYEYSNFACRGRG